MNNETKAVDVLDLMDEAIFTLGLPDNNTPNDNLDLPDLRNARAAVAELIEAAKGARGALANGYDLRARLTALDAALARVQGGA